MVLELWKKIKVFCANHEDETNELELKSINAHNILYYCCPHCSNRISMPDYDKMITKIDSLVTENVSNACMSNLTNTRWKTSKGIQYKVLEHDCATDEMKISVLNKQEI